MAGSLAVPVKFSSTLGSSCRMEYEEDRSRSQASRSQPPRCYNGRQRSDSVSQRASTGVGHIINTLRDSFGHVRRELVNYTSMSICSPSIAVSRALGVGLREMIARAVCTTYGT
eukprot:scaffold15072_cov68-Phaeocystis_antarctica.AAC.14